MKNKLLTTILITCLFSISKSQTKYYVDFAVGSNTNTGMSTATAWKHCPGDPLATGVVATKTLQPGDTVFFKGGVSYNGSVKIKNGGSSGNPVVFCGNRWPGLMGVKAIVDGSNMLTGWTYFQNGIYQAPLPTGYFIGPDSAYISMWQNSGASDNFVYSSQSPNPSSFYRYDDHNDFYSVPTGSVTVTSISDPSVFNQASPLAWQGSSIMFWGNPNVIYYRKILSFNPSTNTITFKPLPATAIYTVNPTQRYAVYNSLNAIDKKGEYYLDAVNRILYLYPNDSVNINNSVSIAARGFGFDLQDKSNLSIEGFIVQKQGVASSLSARDAIGIGNWVGVYSTRKNNIIIRDNVITKLSHNDAGPGGIYVTFADTVLIENNVITNLYQTKSIACVKSSKVIVRNNVLRNAGHTCIQFYTVKNSQITGNIIDSVLNAHANGITTYLGCKNMLIASNKLTNCITPITFQDGGDLFYINNFVDARYERNNVDEWGRTSNPDPTVHQGGAIVFVNNTFVRNEKNSALNIGDCPYPSSYTQGTLTVAVPSNTYIVKNNLLDGGVGQMTLTAGPYYIRDHNHYLGKSTFQKASNNWFLGPNELFNSDSSQYFANPVALDFSLKPNSLAIDSGTSVLSYIPTNLFPEYDFNKDINGNSRGAIWDLGAYEFTAILTNLNNFVESQEETFKVYPNPTEGDLILDLAGLKNEYYLIEVLNTLGQVVFSEASNDKKIILKTESLSRGVYFIKIQNKSVKFIKA